MFPKRSRSIGKIFLYGLFMLLLCGCSDLTGNQPVPQTSICDQQVDPLFREFHKLLNIKNEMGCAISPAFSRGNSILQYTQAGLLRYDPTQPVSQRFSLEPLGQQYLRADTPLSIGDTAEPAFIDGRFVYDKFLPNFNAMEGTRYVGKPITQPFVDYENHWIVQFFSNLAYYTSSIDAMDGVHLVQLGSLACGDDCKHPPVGGFIPGKPEITEPFLEHIRLLGLDLTGKPLSNYTHTQDGYIEQIYENVVVRVKDSPPYPITLLPLANDLVKDNSLIYFQPGARIDDPGFIFNPDANNNEIGFNEEILFEQWVATHGSKAISGSVISQIFPEGNVFRQCYANYCLDYDPATQTISPVALGKQYLQLHPTTENNAQDSLTLKNDNTILQLTESNPLVSSQENQTITIWVFQRIDQYPIPNVDATLTVIMPDGSTSVNSMPATDVKGQSSYTLPPISAINGTLVPYKVCLNPASPTPMCAEDTFVIWLNP